MARQSGYSGLNPIFATSSHIANLVAHVAVELLVASLRGGEVGVFDDAGAKRRGFKNPAQFTIHALRDFAGVGYVGDFTGDGEALPEPHVVIRIYGIRRRSLRE